MGRVKLRASSLVEVVVALVIIIVSFALCVMIFTQTGLTAHNGYLEKGMAELDSYIQATRLNKNYFNERKTVGKYTVERRASAYDNYDNLLLLQFYIYGSDRNILRTENILVLYEKDQ